MSAQTHSQECIDVCNRLLRGEISAREAYDDALIRFKNEPEAAHILDRIREDHVASADLLRKNVRMMEGTPDEGSGAWGAFAVAVQNSANLFGEKSSLQSLIEGEEHGRSQYLNALQNEDVMPQCQELIRDELLPRQERHLTRLKSLKKDV